MRRRQLSILVFSIAIWLVADHAVASADLAQLHAVEPGPEPPGAPNLERMIKAAVARFGGEAKSATDGVPANLIDCVDFDTSPPALFEDNTAASGTEWMFDGAYGWEFRHFANGMCVVVFGGGDSRGLTATEARAFLAAVRAGMDDPRHPEAQRAHNCLAKAAQEYGGNIPDYESGSINGRRFRVFYAALDPDLKRLDEAQHAFVAERKQAWRQLPALSAHRIDSEFDVEIRVRSTGRTLQLATLEATEAPPGAQDVSALVPKNWMLHIPTGRMLTFEDLFADPKAARAEIVACYLRGVPQYLDHVMSSLAFVGEDPEQQAADFRARYLLESHRIATAPAEHFYRVLITADGQRAPSFVGEFSQELLPDRSSPVWNAQAKDLSPYFKPEFRHVLDGMRCPQMPAS